MELSVILPIFNGEQTLVSTLDSLVNQTYKNFELIACIDGSKDSCELILKQYSSKFKVLKILENKVNLGLGPTMNRLFANTEGKYIAVAEQDDFYYPNRLELQLDFLKKNKDSGMVSGIAEFWNGTKVTMKFPGLLVQGKRYPEGKEMFLLNYRNQMKVVNSCMMFRKQIHIDNGLYFTQHYPNIPIDWAYILRFSLISKIHGLNEILVRLDRRVERNSVTTYKDIHNKASRELIRSFRYEYPEIISKKDYIFSLNTQRLLELGQDKSFVFLFKITIYIIKNPRDNRFFKRLIKRIKNYKK